MTDKKISDEIVLHLRGFFTAPILSSFGRLGIIETILKSENFSIDDFGDLPNKQLLESSFEYFTRIGLLEKNQNQFQKTKLGQQLFLRVSSFYVPHSYHRYMSSYHHLLQNQVDKTMPEVERIENILGSGQTHLRYFPQAISFLKRKAIFDVLVDIGCGNGVFLSSFMETVPEKQVIGIDISKISCETSTQLLSKNHSERFIKTICQDAFEIEQWSTEVSEVIGSKKIALSMWFLLHEISQNNPEIIINYFKQLQTIFPSSPIVLCDLVRHNHQALATNRESSIMPEYLFFHDISGQGILSWEEYQHILKEIPYKLTKQFLFDELNNSESSAVPSAFIWCLNP